jgi:hypothetical protein
VFEHDLTKMMVPLEDTAPLSQQEECKLEFETMDRNSDTEICIELYQKNSSDADKQHDMSLGSEDVSSLNWFYSCFGCVRRGGSGAKSERANFGEKQDLVRSRTVNATSCGRDSFNSRNTLITKDERI